jgi:hypothetical protein
MASHRESRSGVGNLGTVSGAGASIPTAFEGNEPGTSLMDDLQVALWNDNWQCAILLEGCSGT